MTQKGQKMKALTLKKMTVVTRHKKASRFLSKPAGGRRATSNDLKPKLIAFELTRRCRYQCKHCRADAGSDSVDQLSTQQCKKIIASIARFAKPVLIITGGEPMERPDLLEIVEYAHERGLRVVMATCGYLMTDEMMAKLKKAGLMALAFSIDGSSAETHDKFRGSDGAFDAVLRAVDMAKRAKIPFQINTTISRYNAGEIIGIVELATRLGATCFNAFMMVPTGRGEDFNDMQLDPVEYESILGELAGLKLESKINIRVTCGPAWARICEQAKQRGLTGTGCMGGRGFGFVSWKGDIQTCGFLDISAGNLVKKGFKFREIWLKSKFLNDIRDLDAYKDKCGECEFLGVCGGCRARAMAKLGDYMAGDPLCGYIPKLRTGK